MLPARALLVAWRLPAPDPRWPAPVGFALMGGCQRWYLTRLFSHPSTTVTMAALFSYIADERKIEKMSERAVFSSWRLHRLVAFSDPGNSKPFRKNEKERHVESSKAVADGHK